MLVRNWLGDLFQRKTVSKKTSRKVRVVESGRSQIAAEALETRALLTNASVSLQLVELPGDLTPGTISDQEVFDVELNVRDTVNDQAAFAGYADVVFDPNHLEVLGITHDANYSSGITGSFDNVLGEIDELGGTGGLAPAAESVVATVRFRAKTAGASLISTNPGEALTSEIVSYAVNNMGDLRSNTSFGSLAVNPPLITDYAISISSGQQVQDEGDAGDTAFAFDVTRSGNTLSASSIDYAVAGFVTRTFSDQAAQATDINGGFAGGTVAFASGEATQQIVINVSGDTNFEGNESFAVSLIDPADGSTISDGFASATILDDDAPPTVSAVTGSNGAIDIEFSHPIDESVLNLYDVEAGTFGVADVTVVGSAVDAVPVVGSLVVNGSVATFVPTLGVLPADTYTVTVRGAADGFRSLVGQVPMDGDGNGSPGGDFVDELTIGAAAPIVVSLPNFARGQGQAVNVPASGMGLPILISDTAGIESMDLSIQYDPALLTISDAVLASNAPAGSSLTVNATDPGFLVLSYFTTTTLTSGSADFIRLVAKVPADAPYRDTQVVRVTNLSINEDGLPATADAALHTVSLFGDATGNGDYSGTDAQRVARNVVQLDSGFESFPLVDPVIIGDTTTNGDLSGSDAQRISLKVVGLPQTDIPFRSESFRSTESLTVTVDVPRDITGSAGGKVTVPINISDTTGLESADVALSYDASLLSNPVVSRGSVWTEMVSPTVNGNTPGELILTINQNAALEAGSGSLYEIEFDVAAGAALDATSVIDLKPVTRVNEGTIDLATPPVDGADASDGLFTVVPDPVFSFDFAPTGTTDFTTSLNAAPGAPVVLDVYARNATAATINSYRVNFDEVGTHADLLPLISNFTNSVTGFGFTDGDITDAEHDVASQSFTAVPVVPDLLLGTVTLTAPAANGAYPLHFEAGSDLNHVVFGGIQVPEAFNNLTINVAAATPDFALTIDTPNQDEGNAGQTPFTFTVTRTGDTSEADTVEFTIAGATSNPADAADIQSGFASGMANFDAGDPTATFDINVNGDTDFEPDEGFIVTLVNPSRSGTISGTPQTAIIQNDDAAPPVTPQLIGIDFGGGTVPTNWTGFSGTSDTTLSNLIDEAGTATTIDVAVDVDSSPGGNESVSFIAAQLPNHTQSLSGVDGAYSDLGGIELEFSSLIPGQFYEVYVFGGDTFAATQRVTISEPTSGTQLATFDQTHGINELNVNSGVGDSARDLSSYAVLVAADASGELLIRVDSSPTPGGFFGLAGVAIREGVAPKPALSVDDVSVDEDAGTLTFTVTADRTDAADITFDFTTADGTAVQPGDYTTNSGSGTITAGTTTTTVVVPIINDSANEVAETFLLNLSNVSANATLADDQGVGTIQDNDPVMLSIEDASGIEGSGLVRFTVTADSAPAADVTFEYTTLELTATEGTDYTGVLIPQTASIRAGETTTTIDIVVANDGLDEIDEIFSVLLANPSANAEFTDFAASGTIIDDDDVQLSVGDVTVDEGAGTATITITADQAPVADATVTWATSDGSATAGLDYTSGSASSTIAAGTTSTTFTVSILEDALDEVSETLNVTLSGPSAGVVIDDGTGVVTITDNDDVELSVGDVTVDEGAGTATITITADQAPVADATVTWATSDGSATAGLDYTSGSASSTIAAGTTSTTFTVSILEDALDEVSETLNVTLSGPSAGVVIDDGTGVVTITDNDDVELSVGDVTVDEGAGTATITITADQAPVADATVTWATSDGSATAGLDYTSGSASSTIAAGTTSTTFTVSILEDALDEVSETLNVTLSGPSAGVVIDDGTGVVTITDNDDVQVSVGDVTVDEGAGTATITITADQAPVADATVTWATSDGSATAGLDYTSGSASSTIAAGTTSTTFTVSILEDALDELSETFDVTLSGPSAGVVIDDGTGVVTITDNDDVQLSVGDVTVDEGAGTATITITADQAPVADATVTWATSDGSATAGLDYTSGSASSTIAAGTTSTTFTVSILEDALDEVSETLNVTLSGPSAGVVIDDGTGVVTITDNDDVELSVGDVTVDEGAGTATITITADQAPVADATVTWATSDGSATAGLDYTSGSASSTIAAGTTSTTFTVSILEDALDELSETFDVTLSGPSAGVAIDDGTGVVTITDNDDVELSVGDVTVDEGAGTATITITADQAPVADATVTWATSDGSATAGLDYTSGSASSTITAGTTSTTFTVSILEDALDELSETFNITLSSPSAGAVIGDGIGVVTITDNETLSISIADATADEGAGTITFALTANRVPASDVTFDFTTADVAAAAGSDYIARSGSVTIDAGSTSGTIVVDILDDGLNELTETFHLIFSNVSANASLTRGAATGTITDNDDVQLSVADVTVDEGAGTATITITADQAPAADATVTWATSDDTASAGSDYTAGSATSTITAGTTSTTFTVDLTDDSLDELSETFSVTLSSPSAGVAINDGTAVVTITDNDVVSLSIDDVAVDESAGTMTFTVTADQAPVDDVTFSFVTADVSATSGQDYAATSGTDTILAGQTTTQISIGINDDGDDEPDETFTVTLSAPSDGHQLGKAVGVGTIRDDDDSVQPTLEFNLDAASISEAGGTTIATLTRTGDLSQSVTVGLTGTDPTEISLPSSARFIAGEATTTFTVTGVPDSLIDGTQTVSIQASGIGFTSAMTDLNVTDSDVADVGISFVSHGFESRQQDGEFAISLSVPAEFDLQVPLVEMGSATAGVDYADFGGFVTIPAGRTDFAFTVQIVDDQIAEFPDILSVQLMEPNIAGVAVNVDPGQSQARMFLLDDDSAGIRVSSPSVSVSEDLTMETFDVTLASQPTGVVTIDVIVSDPTEVTVDVAQLQFDSTNWNVGQTVTVTGADDGLADGAVESLLTLQVRDRNTAPDLYRFARRANVEVTTFDNEPAVGPPTVASVTFYNADADAERDLSPEENGQRSLIRQIEVVVDGTLAVATGTVGDDSFVLTQLDTSADVGLHVDSVSSADGQTTVVLSFTDGTDASGSLTDGNYELTINGATLGVDADDSGAVGGSLQTGFHRLFGDSDGDRDVDGIDFGNYRKAIVATVAQPSIYSSVFDFDNDGQLFDDMEDLDEVIARFGKRLSP